MSPNDPAAMMTHQQRLDRARITVVEQQRAVQAALARHHNVPRWLGEEQVAQLININELQTETLVACEEQQQQQQHMQQQQRLAAHPRALAAADYGDYKEEVKEQDPHHGHRPLGLGLADPYAYQASPLPAASVVVPQQPHQQQQQQQQFGFEHSDAFRRAQQQVQQQQQQHRPVAPASAPHLDMYPSLDPMTQQQQPRPSYVNPYVASALPVAAPLPVSAPSSSSASPAMPMQQQPRQSVMHDEEEKAPVAVVLRSESPVAAPSPSSPAASAAIQPPAAAAAAASFPPVASFPAVSPIAAVAAPAVAPVVAVDAYAADFFSRDLDASFFHPLDQASPVVAAAVASVAQQSPQAEEEAEVEADAELEEGEQEEAEAVEGAPSVAAAAPAPAPAAPAAAAASSAPKKAQKRAQAKQPRTVAFA
jgi:hypothetical protein